MKALSLFLGLLLLMAATACAGDVLTQHNNLSRTGANLDETILTPDNVNVRQFGKLFARTVDGQVYAQPLYVQGLTIGGQKHNIVFVCTESNSVYAFDADNPADSTPLWHVNLGTPVPYSEVSGYGCNDLKPLIGITSTPVIDTNTGTIYVETKTVETNGSTNYFFHKLHALDITNGQEKFGGPVTILGRVGNITFNAQHGNQRAGLLLLSNVVYVAMSSHCDWMPYNGWLFGYNSTNLQQQVAIFNTTPSSADGEGAIWACGMAPAADTNGNIYVVTANGAFDAEFGGSNYGMCFLKLNTTNGLHVADWFSPYNEAMLSSKDRDLGSGGPMLLPGTHLMVGLDKIGTMFLVDRNHLGHFTSITGDPNIVEEFKATAGTDCIGQDPVDWQGPTNQFIFISSGNGQTKAFDFTGTNIVTTPLATGSVTQADRPGGLSLSANGATNGILWVIDHTGGGTIRAYDAAHMPTELWDSQQDASRDALGAYVKFASPTIANGKVYVATASQLVVYGLLKVASAFSLSVSPTSQVVGTDGVTTRYTVTIVGTNGFAGNVVLSVSGLPTNTAASFNPNSVSGSGNSTLTVTTSNNTPSGGYPLTITGAAGAGGYSNAATVRLMVAAPPRFVSLFDGKTLHGWIQDPTNFTLFTRGDFINLPALARKLANQSDSVSALLNERLNGTTKAALDRYVSGNGNAKRLGTDLARSFNKIISGTILYDPKRFRDISLRPETKKLLREELQLEQPGGQPLVQLNRMLLEDAFPSDLAKSPDAAWIVRDGAIASTGAGRGTLYSVGDYTRYRIWFTMRHVAGKPDHQACVLVFCTRPPPGKNGLDALGGIQFQVPNGGHWDYRPGHNNSGRGEFRALPHPKFNPNEWSRVELLVDAAKGIARMAVAQPVGSKAVEVLDFKDPVAGKIGPFAMQMHNAGLFDEYKDIEIEVNPRTDNLITLHQASDGSRTVKGRSVNEFPGAPTRSSP